MRLSLSRLVVFFVLLGFLGGCTQSTDKPLTIAINQWTGYQPLVYARSLGYIQRDRIHLATLGSTTESLIQFRAGNADAITVTLDEALLLKSEGYDISIVLVMDISNGGDAIVSKPHIRNIHQLEGRRVGVENTAVGAYVLTRALEQANMALSDIEAVPLSADQHINLFKFNDIDAVVTFEPSKSELLTQGGHIIFDSSMIPNEIIDVLVINNSILPQHQEHLNQAIQAWFKAIQYIESHPSEAIEWLANNQRTNSKTMEQALSGIRFPDKEQNLKMLSIHGLKHRSITKLSDIMMRHRLLQRRPETQGLMNNSFVK